MNDLLAAEQRLPELIDTLQLDTTLQAAVQRYVAGIYDCIAGSDQWHAHGTRRKPDRVRPQ
jgi:ribosome assembly protein YihI (activator of Der GTPase)